MDILNIHAKTAKVHVNFKTLVGKRDYEIEDGSQEMAEMICSIILYT